MVINYKKIFISWLMSWAQSIRIFRAYLLIWGMRTVTDLLKPESVRIDYSKIIFKMSKVISGLMELDNQPLAKK